MKQVKIFGIIAGLTFANFAYANHTVCKNGTQERHVEVVSSNATTGVPCEVKYTRDGQSNVLWSAKSDAGFCKAKAESFADKLKSSGWNCGAEEHAAVAQAAPAAEAAKQEVKVDEKAKRKAAKAEAKAKRKAEKEAAKAQREADKKAEQAKQEAAKAEKKAEAVKEDASKKVEEVKKDTVKKAEEVKKEVKEEASKVKAKVEENTKK